ncbi:MAG: type secretion system protein GspD [Proteobacteria bacterium]|nr:type secretion system protein GspD [Pseudomonadota bacterium]
MKVKALTATCLLCVALFSSVHAADDRVTLNFVNSDLEATLKAVTIITGKSFVIDPKLKGTVSIVSNQPVDRNLVLPIVQSALRQQGITLIDNGTVVKVVAEADAKQQGSAVLLGKNTTGTGDKFVTQVYPLRFESASQLAQVLRPLLGANSVIAAYQAGNVLVISDYAENLSRINAMIENIDHPPLTDIVSIPIKYASTLDVAQTIARMVPEVVLQGSAAPVPVADGVKRVLIVNDVRNSQLLVSSESTAHIERIKRIVDMLDQPGTDGSTMHVVYLKNAEATRLGATLRGILTGQDSSNSNSSGLSGTGSSASTTSSSSTSSSTAASSAAQNSTSAGTSSTNVKIDGFTVLIQADAVTNSLIVTAPDRIYNDIRNIIDKLDVRRAQVYIEALIAEINVSKSAEAGVQWGGYGKTASGLFGGMLSSVSTTSTNNLSTLATSYLTGGTTGVTVPGGFNLVVGAGSFGAMVSAIEESSDANVLSKPNIQMLDNEEARIVVGQNIPIKTGTTVNTSSSYTSVERKDIGVKLKIKPQISEGGAITLTVAQEVSSIDSTVDSTDGIGLKVRSVETKVLVDDGQLVVLGGLIEDKVTNSENRVPLLADIPYLGQLFRYRSRSQTKTNLIVFLHPVLLKDGAANNALANERYEYIRSQQSQYNPEKSKVLPPLPAVELPKLEDKKQTEKKVSVEVVKTSDAASAAPASSPEKP